MSKRQDLALILDAAVLLDKPAGWTLSCWPATPVDTVRPAIADLVQHFATAGSSLLVAGQGNAEDQIAAACRRLRVEGKTLAELGFQVVPLQSENGCKDVAAIRSWGKLDELCLAVVLDTAPDRLANISRSDHVVGIPPPSQKEAEQEMVNSAKAATHSLPRLGVSLHFLRAFKRTCMDSLADPAAATTADVCMEIVKPAILSAAAASDSTAIQRHHSGMPINLSFANLVQRGLVPQMLQQPKDNHVDVVDMVGNATHFVSHAWSYRFLDLMDALEIDIGALYGGDEKRTCFFWLDMFVVPQARPVTPPLAWWATTFFTAIASLEHFVLVAFKWSAPRCVTRCWCLWEIYAAVRMGKTQNEGKLHIIMPQSERQSFSKQLLVDVHGVQKAVLRVDASQAEAWNPADKAMIFEAIRSHTFNGVASFDGLNAIIKHLLQSWISRCGSAICDDESIDKVEAASLRHAVALIRHQRTEYTLAEEQFRLALAAREMHLGKNADDTLETLYRLACTLRKDSTKLEDAKQLLQRVSSTESASEETRRRSQKILAEMVMESGDVAQAASLLRELVAFYSSKFPGEQRSIQLAAKNGELRQLFHCEKLLGTALRELGQVDEAVALHEAMVRDWSVLDGESHDNALAGRSELAKTLSAKGRNAEARQMMEGVVQARVREDGEEHKKTKAARKLLESLPA
mmetsp:Transcript_140953/g.270494  ORF Transcript_140953/g.270494 Transcript_140953/m.270494 type:complete len:689 (+) Transcript_140953:55-2121(+)